MDDDKLDFLDRLYDGIRVKEERDGRGRIAARWEERDGIMHGFSLGFFGNSGRISGIALFDNGVMLAEAYYDSYGRIKYQRDETKKSWKRKLSPEMRSRFDKAATLLG